jgi:hypothetical protein
MDHFEFYYAYLAQCERDNWANMRDPNHDYMEWNHTLPQCIFGDQPVGQWLTIEQHAIASALQTLAFKVKCVCPWHHKFLSKELRSLVRPYFAEGGRAVGSQYGKQNGERQGKYLLENELGLFDPQYNPLRAEWFKRGSETQKKRKIGLFGDRSEWIETYRENGRIQGTLSYENGTGLFSPEAKRKLEEAQKQLWSSTLDGFVSTAAGVAAHNRSIGGTGKDKIKLQES